VEEQAVVKMLSLGLEVKEGRVDCVDMTAARARRQILLDATLDKPPQATGSSNVLKGEASEVGNRRAARVRKWTHEPSIKVTGAAVPNFNSVTPAIFANNSASARKVARCHMANERQLLYVLVRENCRQICRLQLHPHEVVR
jgi:hypothetical protein